MQLAFEPFFHANHPHVCLARRLRVRLRPLTLPYCTTYMLDALKFDLCLFLCLVLSGSVGAAVGALIGWRGSYFVRGAYFGSLVGFVTWSLGVASYWANDDFGFWQMGHLNPAMGSLFVAGLFGLLIPIGSRLTESVDPPETSPASAAANRLIVLWWTTSFAVTVGIWYFSSQQRFTEMENLRAIQAMHPAAVHWGKRTPTGRHPLVVTLYGADDQTLVRLGTDRGISELSIVDSRISLAGLRQLSACEDLTKLNVGKKSLDGPARDYLAALPACRELSDAEDTIVYLREGNSVDCRTWSSEARRLLGAAPSK